jgi:TRAP-type transport system periplasmic protein
MKVRFGFMLLTVVLMVALILAACAPSPAPSPAPKPSPAPAPTPTPQPKTLKFSYTMPKGASIGAGFEVFAQEFPKRTEGRYKVETYPGQTLTKLPEALDAIKGRVCEIVGTSVGTFPSAFPLSLIMEVPGITPVLEVVPDYLSAYDMAWEFINTTPEIKAEFKDGIVLQPLVLDSYNFVSKGAEVRVPQDMKGMKIGGSGDKMELVTAMGGARVQVIPPNSYTNLDKGVVEAAFLTFAQVSDYKLYELCKWYSLQSHGGGWYFIYMNKDAYNEMSPADQKVILDTWKEASATSARVSMESVAKGIAECKAKGQTIYDPTPAEKAAWQKGYDDVVVPLWYKNAQNLGISKDTCDKILAKIKDLRVKYKVK